MSNLDDWRAALDQGATFGPDAAGRLEQRLALEPSPRAAAAKRRRLGFVACLVSASLAGGLTGAAMEVRAEPSAAFAPAATTEAMPSVLFFSPER